MNETSVSCISMKGGSPVNNQPWNYKIISINKDQKTNQHSIRIGIDETILRKNSVDNGSECECDSDVSSPGGRIPYQISPSSPNLPSPKVSLKMMPSGQSGSRILKSSSRKVSTEEFCSSEEQIEENVESEPCKRVSTARAMFENMASSSERLNKIKKNSQLKSWNSSSRLLDHNCETDTSNLNVKPTNPHAHSKSKSLPVEITDTGYEKSACTRTSSNFIGTNKQRDNIRHDRYHSYDGSQNLTTDNSTGHNIIDNNNNNNKNNNNSNNSNNNSNNNCNNNHHNNNNSNNNHHNNSNNSNNNNHHISSTTTTTTTTTTNTNIFHHGSRSETLMLMYSNESTLEQQMSSLPSYSSEDLRHYGKDHKDAGRPPSTSSKKDSANELRQATSRYHQHLMKTNPRLRNSITGKDNALKFTSRKTSLPVEEELVRSKSECLVMTTPPHGPARSFSEPLEIQDLNDVLSKTSENSMMSRLLRDNNSTATLMKIDEEIKIASATINNVKVVIRKNSSDNTEQNTGELGRQNFDKLCYDYNKGSSRSCSSIDSSMDPEYNEQYVFTDSQRMHRYSGARSTGSIVPEMKSISIQTEARLRREDNNNWSRQSGSTDSLNGDHPRMKHQSSSTIETTSVKELVEKDTPNESNESITTSAEQLSSTSTDIDLKLSFDDVAHETAETDNATLKDPLYTHVETDIDAEEAPEIIHRKDLSSDSAVYVIDDDHISHSKALSNESTDSLQEYSDLSYKHYDEGGYLPEPPTHDILPYEEDQSDDVNEKEKKTRTINRRKKDSSLAGSRYTSCVSTDSTASTATIDSGIVVCSDSSQRTSPMSNASSYYNNDLNGSRETLDDDIIALHDESGLMSTPDRNKEAKTAGYQLLGKTYSSSMNESPLTSGENSRRGSMNSPRSGDLDNEKAKLVGSMREKISELRDQEQEIADEIKMNEDLGKKVLSMVKIKATQIEFSKFELFIGELNKIVALLLSLTQRLHRYELMLQDLDMSNEGDKAKKDGLISKIDKLKSQHEEACYLRDVNNKRGDAVASFLERYCTEEEFADFQYYVDMKSQLALMQSEIREKVKLGEERLKALEQTNSEWGYK